MEQFPLQPVGKILIISGIFVALLGLVLLFADKIPFLGRLPGDILIRKKNFTFYFPLATLIVLNLVLFLISYFLRK
jgi:hypothetical protein